MRTNLPHIQTQNPLEGLLDFLILQETALYVLPHISGRKSFDIIPLVLICVVYLLLYKALHHTNDRLVIHQK